MKLSLGRTIAALEDKTTPSSPTIFLILFMAWWSGLPHSGQGMIYKRKFLPKFSTCITIPSLMPLRKMKICCIARKTE